MRVETLTLFMSGGIEMTFKVNEKGLTVEHLNYAFESLEKKVPSFTLDLEDDDGKKSRIVMKTDSIYFYQAVFGEPLLTYDEFSNRVEKRLREVEYNHNVKGIVISEEDYKRFYPDGSHLDGLRYFGRVLSFDSGLRTGEVEMITDKGEVI